MTYLITPLCSRKAEEGGLNHLASIYFFRYILYLYLLYIFIGIQTSIPPKTPLKTHLCGCNTVRREVLTSIDIYRPMYYIGTSHNSTWDTYMPHVLKDTTIQFIGTDELPTVRMLLKMSRAAGAVWLQINRPTWPQDITDDMLKLCSTATAVNSYQSLEEQRTYRRHFCAAAWIMGASWSTLGAFFNVSRESISSSVNRILPTQVRELTGRPPHISFARVEELYEGYKRIMASIPLKEIQSLSARELGQLLDATAPKPDDEGEDTLSLGIQNRIPSVDLS